MNIIDAPTRRLLPVRVGKPAALLLHTTGATHLPGILAYYQAADGLQPHYCIGCDGTVYRIVPEDHIAWHCALDPHEVRLYRMGYETWSTWVWRSGQPMHLGVEAPNYLEWRLSWLSRGKQSPLDLVTGDHPNAKSVGIELQQPTDPTPRIFTEPQYEALAWLAADVAGRHAIPIDREHILGHYDCSPMMRSTSHGNWDPGQSFGWQHLWDLLAGAPKP